MKVEFTKEWCKAAAKLEDGTDFTVGPMPLGYVVEHNLPPASPHKWSFHPVSEGLSFYKDTALQILPVYTEPPPPDCRTCANRSDCDHYYTPLTRDCTNGDKYQEAPAVVLWRTRHNSAMTGPAGVQVHEPVGRHPPGEE